MGEGGRTGREDVEEGEGEEGEEDTKRARGTEDGIDVDDGNTGDGDGDGGGECGNGDDGDGVGGVLRYRHAYRTIDVVCRMWETFDAWLGVVDTYSEVLNDKVGR